MTFETMLEAMLEDAMECNRRADEVFRPKDQLEALICPVCGSSYEAKGYKPRTTCSRTCAQRSRADKLGELLRERRMTGQRKNQG